MFGEMDDNTLATVLSYFEWVDLPGGDYLFRQGEVGDTMYILASGRLKVMLNAEESIAEIPPGEPVGEMALITGENRNADILAVRDCVLAKLEKPAFDELVKKYPHVLMHICKTIVERLQKRKGIKRNLKRITNLCALPIGKREIAMQFLHELTVSLEKYGSVLVLESLDVNFQLKMPEIFQAEKLESEAYRRLSTWLEEQENSNRFVIYIPDETETEWTRRCIRQADEILLLADTTSKPNLHEFEKRFLTKNNKVTLVAQTLVLLHPEKTIMPTDTQLWLENREIAFHHHIRLRNPSDAARLGRFLTGTAVGLVLSGGAAKGIAHIGVIRALESAGIVVDMVGGTSIGAIIGGFVGMGWRGEEIREKTRNIFKKNPTSDFNFWPMISIFKGRKLDSLLDGFFGKYRIEDLWLNFFCVSCNLSRTNPRIHRFGNLVDAMRASTSIPGVFPPAVLNNELYVDGGVFNNMPVDEMNRMGAGYIVAVDLQQYHRRQHEPPPEIMGKMPNLLYIIMESSMLSGRYMTQENRQSVDLYFNPEMAGVGMLDWQKFDKIETIGFKHAQEILKQKTLDFSSIVIP